MNAVLGWMRDRMARVALVGLAAAGSVAVVAGPGIGAAYGADQIGQGSPCTLKTGFSQDSTKEFPASDQPPATTCVRSDLMLVGSSSTQQATPKGGATARLMLKITTDETCALAGADASCPLQGEKWNVEVAVPRGFTLGSSLPNGFKKTTFYDPFTATRDGSWGDSLHAAKVAGTVTLRPGMSVNVYLPVTLASAGSGSAEATLTAPVGTASAASFAHAAVALVTGRVVFERPPGSSTHATWTWNATGGSNAIVSAPDPKQVEKPEDWNVDRAGSLDIPVKTVPGDGNFKGVAWKPYAAPRDKEGLCPGEARPQENGVCPGVTGLADPANQQFVRSSRRAARRAHAAGNTCMQGQLVYSDPTGVHPAVNVPVEAWDVNTAIDDHIGDAFTDASGNFSVCFDNSERGYFQGGTADVKLVFVSANNRFRVVNDCCLGTGVTPGTYNLTRPTQDNVPSGTVNVGTLSPSNMDFQRVFHAYDLLNRAWAWSNSRSPGSGTCWSNGDCDQKTIQWWPSSSVWPHYGGNCLGHLVPAWVCLPGPGPDSSHTVLHEIGHNVMDDTFGGMPPHSCPSPHYLTTNEEAGCAWTEGWPTWYAAAIMNKPVVDGYPTTTPYQSDNDSWQNYNGRARGSNVEGRIVGALWDLQDSNNEGVWDRSSLGSQVLWDAFRKRKPQSWSGMITALSQEGVDTGASSFRATLYGNTIDMASSPFRDPIGTNWTSRTLPPVSAPSLSGTENTSNDHGFVWNRSSVFCTDRVEVENVGSWSGGYRQANSSQFTFGGFRLSAYSSSNLSSGLLASAGGSSSLWSAGSLSISLPTSPASVYVKTNGSARATAVPNGADDSLPTSHYRIRGVKCSPFSLSNPWMIDFVRAQSGLLELAAGTTYTVTYTPSGKATTGKSQRARLRVGNQGWALPCVQDSQNGGKCDGGSTSGVPLVTASNTASSAGRPVSVSFTPQKGGMFEVVYDSLEGTGKGSVVVVAKPKA